MAHSNPQQAALTEMLPREQLKKAAYYMYHGIIPETYEGNVINGIDTFLERAEKIEEFYRRATDDSNFLSQIFRKEKIKCDKYDWFPFVDRHFGFGELFYPIFNTQMKQLLMDGDSCEEDIQSTRYVDYKGESVPLLFFEKKEKEESDGRIYLTADCVGGFEWDTYLGYLMNSYVALKRLKAEQSQPKITPLGFGISPVFNGFGCVGTFSMGVFSISTQQYDESELVKHMLDTIKGHINETLEVEYNEWKRYLKSYWKTSLITVPLFSWGQSINFNYLPSSLSWDAIFGVMALVYTSVGVSSLKKAYEIRKKIARLNKNSDAVEKLFSSEQGIKDIDKLMRLLPRIHPSDAQELGEEVTQGKTLADVVDEKAKTDWRYVVIKEQTGLARTNLI
ncbi:hypothetical protein HY636_01075 [Candidatus Woesearchaeota archaeon]|nr:hypothetical protein [Candidatus Woesearchaeota archaeon]